MLGAIVVSTGAPTKLFAVVRVERNDRPPLPEGAPDRLVGSRCEKATRPWLCEGIWFVVSVAVFVPKACPRFLGDRPAPCPCWHAARPARFGSWNVVCPLPP